MSVPLYALILGAGLGTRLRPITLYKPKPLLKFLGEPLLEVILKRILKLDPEEVFINSFHLHELLEEEVLSLERKYRVKIQVFREEELLDTGGTVKRIVNYLRSKGLERANLLVHNGDVIPLVSLRSLLKAHLEWRSSATLLCAKPSPLKAFPSMTMPLNTYLRGDTLLEIPSKRGNCHFCGVYLLNVKDTLGVLPEEDKFSVLKLFRRLPTKAYLYEGISWDMGTFRSLLSALADLSLLTAISLRA